MAADPTLPPRPELGPAFRDAARRAPNWSYPLHNLALAYVEAGDYQNAIRSYQQAMRLTPQFSYLPYNLGLVYQRLNRRREAETEYRRAMVLAPDSAEPLNALGSLKASEGKSAEAEKFYRDALQKSPSLLAARHNLGLLLASLKGRQSEAIDAWKQNIAANPDYLADCMEARVVPGDGEFDCVGFIAELKSMGVRAPVSLEVCSSELWAAPVDVAAQRAADGMRRILQQFGDG